MTKAKEHRALGRTEHHRQSRSIQEHSQPLAAAVAVGKTAEETAQLMASLAALVAVEAWVFSGLVLAVLEAIPQMVTPQLWATRVEMHHQVRTTPAVAVAEPMASVVPVLVSPVSFAMSIPVMWVNGVAEVASLVSPEGRTNTALWLVVALAVSARWWRKRAGRLTSVAG